MNNFKILIVDDKIDNIKTIIRLFEESQSDYRLYQATSGYEAKILVEKISFDLIIADWQMPEMSGIELIKELNSNIKTKHIPVIIQTGVMITSNDLEVALNAGAFDYIRKPIDPIELKARTHSALMLAHYHIKEIKSKDLELTEKTMNLIKDHEFNVGLSKKLNKLYDNLDNREETKEFISKIISDVEGKIRQDSWQRFEVAFENVHPEFIKKMISNFGNLSKAELRLCILIKLGTSIKDTASLLIQNPESIKVARARLRKKLNITCETNLHNFLSSF